MQSKAVSCPALAGAGWKRARASSLALVLGASVLLSAAPAGAESEWEEAGIGLGVAVVNLLYMPAKILYAAGGTTVAGLAFLFSAGDQDVFGPILNASLRGDYVLTPRHLRGEQTVQFVGRRPRPAVAAGPYGEQRADAESEWSSGQGSSRDRGF